MLLIKLKVATIYNSLVYPYIVIASKRAINGFKNVRWKI